MYEEGIQFPVTELKGSWGANSPRAVRAPDRAASLAPRLFEAERPLIWNAVHPQTYISRVVKWAWGRLCKELGQISSAGSEPPHTACAGGGSLPRPGCSPHLLLSLLHWALDWGFSPHSLDLILRWEYWFSIVRRQQDADFQHTSAAPTALAQI